MSGDSPSFMASISRSSRSTWAGTIAKVALALSRHAEIGAQVEQIVLDAGQHGVGIAFGIHPGHADGAAEVSSTAPMASMRGEDLPTRLRR